MQVKVLYFGILRDVMGADSEDVALPTGSSVATLLNLLERRRPGETKAWAASAIARNLHYLRDASAFTSEILSEGDELAILPPVSGGSHAR